MNYTLWLPVAAAVLAALVHSLSDDGSASILDHFHVTWRVPVAVLPIAILVFGVASGTVSSVVEGKDWQTSLAAAVTSALAGVFGATSQHAMVNRSLPQFVTKPDASKAPLVVIGAALLAISVSACSLFTPANLPKTELAAEEIACILEHAFLDDDTLNSVCKFIDPAKQLAAKEVARAHRESLAKEMKAQRLTPCDAGAEGGSK